MATFTTVPLGFTDKQAVFRLAGTPAQSNTISGPSPSLSSWLFATISWVRGSSTLSWMIRSFSPLSSCTFEIKRHLPAPKSLAKACLTDEISDTMTLPTPRARRHWTTARPMGPPPKTRTTEDVVKGEAEIACHATDSGSTNAVAFSQESLLDRWPK